MSRRAQQGFTLVELLVVVLIIAILMGLLLPVLGAARERARQAQCMQNQKQIADAMVSYATVQNKMPATMSVMTNPTTGQQVVVGWVQGLFAQLGHGDLTIAAAGMTSATNPPPPQVTAPNISLLLCPDDTAKIGAPGGPLTYVPNGGCFNNWGAQQGQPFDDSPNGAWDYRVPANGRPTPQTTLGYIGKYDGISSTISHSENLDATTYIPVNALAEPQETILWSPNGDGYAINQNAGQGVIDNAHARPSSNHPNGLIIAFCDTSVKFVNQSIAYNIYATLLTSNGAQAHPPGVAPTYPLPNPYSSFQVFPLSSSSY